MNGWSSVAFWSTVISRECVWVEGSIKIKTSFWGGNACSEKVSIGRFLANHCVRGLFNLERAMLETFVNAIHFSLSVVTTKRMLLLRHTSSLHMKIYSVWFVDQRQKGIIGEKSRQEIFQQQIWLYSSVYFVFTQSRDKEREKSLRGG